MSKDTPARPALAAMADVSTLTTRLRELMEEATEHKSRSWASYKAKASKEKATLEYVRDLFSYDPESGLLTYKKNHHRFKKGTEAGTINANGYKFVSIKFRLYPVTHMAWSLMTGDWPADQIDHIDRNPLNNRWENLRAATVMQQQGNHGLAKNNTSGFRGVVARKNRWYARMTVGKRTKHIGCFKTKEEAAAAYDKAARERWGDFYSRAAREGAR